MSDFDPAELKKLYRPASDSHKGENGKVLIIAGSTLFHAASIWPLTIASRIVDMVFYSSVEENNELVESIKAEFRNGIVIPRTKLESYVRGADAILIGPGLPREEGVEEGDDNTRELTERLLKSYPDKKWVIDGGSLQTIDPDVLLSLKTTPILTPHKKEFEKLFNNVIPGSLALRSVSEGGTRNLKETPDQVRGDTQGEHTLGVDEVSEMAKKYNCVILLKGEVDIIASPNELVSVSGGNPGMTKGGTGDVLAGLVTSLYAKNDAFLSASAGSYINKKAGESLEKKMGIYFNATDLALEIPQVMSKLLQ